MSPAELPPTQPPEDLPVSQRRESAADWKLTREALDKLLEHFSTDPEEAAERYARMHLKLTRYFEWRRCHSPEAKADEAINRVARRIDEGEKIHNLGAYFSTVAGIIFMESRRDPARDPAALESLPEISAPEPPTEEDEQKESRLSCLDECLEELPIESRSLILAYYDDEERAKITRRNLAAALDIPLNALRIRAHRIRKTLEECLGKCLALRNENGATSL